jgi:hypothetical protein
MLLLVNLWTVTIHGFGMPLDTLFGMEVRLIVLAGQFPVSNYKTKLLLFLYLLVPNYGLVLIFVYILEHGGRFL